VHFSASADALGTATQAWTLSGNTISNNSKNGVYLLANAAGTTVQMTLVSGGGNHIIANIAYGVLLSPVAGGTTTFTKNASDISGNNGGGAQTAGTAFNP
jgi:parallel beta-helix repeat protein